MKENRKLNTILFADIAGYTSLMQNDEVKAMKLLQIFKKILEEKVSKFEGLIVQYFGDACILSFDSTTLGVKCAISLQQDFRESNLPIRIGMHLGEVVFTENNVFGDGVNIASRIESMGVPGAILLSKTVRDQIKNKSEFKLSSLGAFEFKNVKEPLEVYAVANPGFTIPSREKLRGKFKEKPEKKRPKWAIPAVIAGLVLVAIFILLYTLVPGLEISQDQTENSIGRKGIAVMPFENLSPDNNDLFYCNGIMQNVLDNLSRVPEFIVLPSRTTNLYKDTQLLPTELGEELGVEYLIDGTFQKIDSLIQVTVALTSTHDGRQIWTNEKVTFSLPELFAMQAQIANQVANHLKIGLREELNKTLETLPTRDEIAYQYYLRGKEKLKDYNTQTRSSGENAQALNEAKLLFNLALERDTHFAAAYLGLAKIEYNEKYWANLLKDSTLYDYNKLVDKALQLDSISSEGYFLKGLYFREEHEPDLAEKNFLKALDINPNNLEALKELAGLYQDEKFDIIKSIRLLKEIEYRTVSETELYTIYAGLSNAYRRIMDHDMERYYVEKCIAINDSLPDRNIPMFYLTNGQKAKALTELKKRFPNPDNQLKLGLYGVYHYMTGQFEEAVKYYEEWEKLLDIQSPDNDLSFTDWHRYGQSLVKIGQDSLGIALVRKQLSINRQLLEMGHYYKVYDIAGIYSFLNMPDSAYYYMPNLSEAWIRGGTGYFMLIDHQFDNYRADKRFRQLSETAKLKMREIRKQVPSVDPNAPEVN